MECKPCGDKGDPDAPEGLLESVLDEDSETPDEPMQCKQCGGTEDVRGFLHDDDCGTMWVDWMCEACVDTYCRRFDEKVERVASFLPCCAPLIRCFMEAWSRTYHRKGE